MRLTEEWLQERSTPEPNTGCWLWTGRVMGSYAGFGKDKYVHRAILGLTKREEFACHTCDQKLCVNPAHLYRGDIFTNAKDFLSRQGHHNTKKTTCPRGHAYDAKVWNGKYWARSCTKCRNPINRK